jgi:nicotinate phosphoribosyltransferase
MPTSRPQGLFVTEEDLALATDLYQLTMSAAYFEKRRAHAATFEMFVRRMPADRGYLIAAGLEQVVHYLLSLRFGADAIAFLRQHAHFAHVSAGFFEYLAGFRFSGSVDAIPEGSVVFEGEPLLRVTAPIIEAQVVETYILTTLNYQTLVATKAARVVEAAQGRPVVDFGTRRAHGPQAGVLAARAAFIGGCAGTSNVLAAQLLGIPAVGTMAHSFPMTFPSEEEAFRAYLATFPHQCALLVDTYDTIEGTRRAAALGPNVKAVRLDSGDLVALSREARCILDAAGAADTRIIGSGDLNEHRIQDLLGHGAQIDVFGVGTELVTSRDDPTLSGVYKLVEYEEAGTPVPTVKLSADKETYPCRKQVLRRSGLDGCFREDLIVREGEHEEGEPLVVPVLREGRLVYELPSVHDIQRTARGHLRRLPAPYHVLRAPASYPVRHSALLASLRREAATRAG